MFRKTKFWAVMLIALLVVSVFTGCTKTEQSKEEINQSQVQDKAPENKEVILATTTSTVDSGLLDVLQPKFEELTGYQLTVVSVGSGAAIKMAEQGEADALLVHSPKDEERIEEAGVVVNRQLVMHNDFVLIGPAADPAKIKGKVSVEAFKGIADSQALFLSRGDESGTHKKELGIWKKAGITPGGTWYQETGTGMGQTISVAAEKDGYTLTDRATHLAQKENNDLEILSEGDADLLNIYHVMQVNPEKFDKVNAEGGKAFVEFMVSDSTQAIIEEFGVEEFGQPLFYPDAGKDESQLGK